MALLGALSGLLLVLAASPGLAHDEPEAQVSMVQRARVGSDVRVTGTGLTPGSLVSLMVCGNSGRRGSPDCSLASTKEVGISDEGTFSVPLQLLKPPRPCPCAVVVTGGTATPLVRPVQLMGHPVDRTTRGAKAEGVSTPDVVVTSARLSRTSSLGTWFGMPAQGVLKLRMVNTGKRAAAAKVDLGWGASGNEATHWVQAPAAQILTPGQSADLEVPVAFDALGNGQHVVAGSVRASGNESTFEAGATVRPWGLFVLALLAVLILPIALLARFARRQRAREDHSHDSLVEEVLGAPSHEL